VTPHLQALGVTRIAEITGLDSISLPVFVVHRPNARSLSVAQGKGLTEDAARASAVMEALERYHAETPDLPLRYGSVDDLGRSGAVVDLERLPRLEGAGLRPGAKALWVEGVELGTGATAWVPFELVHMDYTLPLPPSLGCFQISSTGLAAGNTREEALVHAIAEVIERDAVTLWRQEPSRHPERRIDLASINDADCRDVLAHFEQAKVALAVWDITTDIGAPAYFAAAIDRRQDAWRGLYAASGSGCHPSRKAALIRALTEVAQSRLTLISGARDDRSFHSYRALLRQDAMMTLRSEIVDGQVSRRFDDLPDRPEPDFDKYLGWLLERLKDAAAGPPVMVDLSKPGIPAAVVRVLVPGLEGSIDVPGYTPAARAAALTG
jgi:ribosomal protein S12 methylthiotransferase accessory factor